MKLTKEDKRIFVTSLNKLDNSRAKELVFWALSDQFLDDNEKASKYDSLMAANSQVVKDNISLTQLHQENKQLKEDLEDYKQAASAEADLADNLQKENRNLKQKLEKIKLFEEIFEFKSDDIKIKDYFTEEYKLFKDSFDEDQIGQRLRSGSTEKK